MNKIDLLLDQLEAKVPQYEVLNKTVSQGNIGWHIEHSLLTLNGITNYLIKSNPNEYKWKFNFMRIVVLTLGKIPRGRAKSPEVVRPKGSIIKESLFQHILEARNKIKGLATLSKDSYFEHPFFGKLKLEQTINFLEIHTKHHLNIIEDIVNK